MTTPHTFLSEQVIIDTITKVLNPNGKSTSVDFNASDDAYFDADKNLILTTDMLIEGTHFKLDWLTNDLNQTQLWEALGWKAVAVNISDIAAMGGQPQHLQVGLGLPKTTSSAFITAFYTGMQSCAKRYNAVITGGDTVRSEHLSLSITATGTLPKGHTLGKRSAAQPGDLVISTGFETLENTTVSHYGMSGGGLVALNQKLKGFPALIDKHLRPTPRIEAGLALSKNCNQYALMDTSDGLADACLKLAKASDVGIEIDASSLPPHPELRRLAQSQHNDLTPTDAAIFCQNMMLYGGEDFELLGCVPPDTNLKPLLEVGFKVIGRVLAMEETTTYTKTKAWLLQDTGDTASLEKPLKTELQHHKTFQH